VPSAPNGARNLSHAGHEGYRVSQATLEDAAAIAHVHVDGWRGSYRGILPDAFLDALSYAQREDLWRNVLDAPAGRHVLVARETDGPVVGFVLGGPPETKTADFRAELHALYVLESHQRRGVGTGLFEGLVSALVEDGVDSMITWVFVENPAVRFYQHMGGSRSDERTIEIAGAFIDEVAYAWSELVTQVLHRSAP
jgi:GNAT superfamily N-acetyltransferase